MIAKKDIIIFVAIGLFLLSCQPASLMNSDTTQEEIIFATPEVSTSINNCHPDDTVGGPGSELGIFLFKKGIRFVHTGIFRKQIERETDTSGFLTPTYNIEGEFNVICCEEPEFSKTVTFTSRIINNKTGEIVGETHTKNCCQPRYKGVQEIGNKVGIFKRIFGGYGKHITVTRDLYKNTINETARKLAKMIQQIENGEEIYQVREIACPSDPEPIIIGCSSEQRQLCEAEEGGTLNEETCECVVTTQDFIEIDSNPTCEPAIIKECENTNYAIFDPVTCECIIEEPVIEIGCGDAEVTACDGNYNMDTCECNVKKQKCDQEQREICEGAERGTYNHDTCECTIETPLETNGCDKIMADSCASVEGNFNFDLCECEFPELN